MKKYILLVAIIGSAMSAIPALAAHNVYDVDNRAVVSTISDEAWVKAQADSRTILDANNKLPIVLRGQSSKDEAGSVSICPIWFIMNCVDISKTDVYRNSMITLAKELVLHGKIDQFPGMAYWAKLAM